MLHFIKQVTLSRAIIKGSSLKISENLAQGVARYSLFSEGYPFFHQNLEILRKMDIWAHRDPKNVFGKKIFLPKVSKQVNEPI